MQKQYTRLIQRALSDPIVRSGMKLSHRLNLFQALEAKPMAPRELATQLHMKERFVWELSQAMMASGVIELNKSGTLAIPSGCSKLLLEATDKAKWEPHLEKTVPILEDCFMEGGKSGYSLDEAPYILDLLNKVRDPYTPSLVESLVGNIQTYHPTPEKIKHILDVGCGSGSITMPLAKGMPGVSVVGCDTSAKALESAIKANKEKNLTFSLVTERGYPTSWMAKFDVIVLFDVLHDLPYPKETMGDIMKVLKDDGILVIIDPDVSSDPLQNVGNLHAANALTFSAFYCVPSSCCSANSAALGISWGSDNKEKFLTAQGLTVRNRVSLLNSLFFHSFVCVKTSSVGKERKM
ncbi:S-adenosylmethionine-dependent methyltransferase Rv2258c-like [Argopecten irradians]|uniref:S-adenosylmethionine-dependent methyltransferase Rv2258c-like n=1 Tax=Argopecten irradians TaxID=31199 RepID=UPI003722E785